jgi:hypothetical protein
LTDWTGIAAVIAPITTLAGVLGGYWLAGRNEEAVSRALSSGKSQPGARRSPIGWRRTATPSGATRW